MAKKNIKKRITPFAIACAGAVLLLIISVFFLREGIISSRQSHDPMMAGITFVGEYKISDGEWKTIDEDEFIPSTKGDVTLKGRFMITDPQSHEILGPANDGMSVALYFNHIGGSILLPTGETLVFDAESAHLGEDACAIMWGSAPIVGSDKDRDFVITLKNPHRFGNERAVCDFLENMSITPGIYLESEILDRGSFERGVGTIIVLSALIILGIAAFSTIIHLNYSRILWLIGLMILFAGGYFMFDAYGVNVWSDSYIFNTRVLGLCIMLYMLSVFVLITAIMKGKMRKISIYFAAAVALTVFCSIIISLTNRVCFFDTWLYWAISTSLACIGFAVLLVISLPHSDKNARIFSIAGLITVLAFPADAIATALGLWEGGFISKLVFIAVFMMALVIVLRIIPAHINAALRARELEAEQKALELELQENRISIMLSQMQPHFIFNTLNTIYHLCDIDPESAKSTISTFSEYLRNNIDNLGRSEMISFEKELSFVRTYLDIEKVRFDDELSIDFDIETTNFKLPVLTVQPIVENAVKHGTSKKEGVASLTLSTRETDSAFEILIEDTGVGFDPLSLPDDGHRHIGISAVRERLLHLCGGTLQIESAVGEGTRALITIPKTIEKGSGIN